MYMSPYLAKARPTMVKHLSSHSVDWGEPERAPHKWRIETKSLHSDGTAYVRTSL